MVCLGFKHHAAAAAGDKALKAQTNHPLSRKNHQESVFLGTIKICLFLLLQGGLLRPGEDLVKTTMVTDLQVLWIS